MIGSTHSQALVTSLYGTMTKKLDIFMDVMETANLDIRDIPFHISSNLHISSYRQVTGGLLPSVGDVVPTVVK